jgi:hypothetical protein
MLRTHLQLFIIAGFLAISCEKDPAEQNRHILNDDILLISVQQNHTKYLEFKYDSLNRLVHSDRYYDDTTFSRTTYGYDSKNRLSSRNYDGYIETFEYNADGLLKSLTKIYPFTNKVWKRMFIYENGKIAKAEIYFNDVQTGHATYKYDVRGNTVEVLEHEMNTGNEEFLMIHQKFTYDNSFNPLYHIGFTSVELTQQNNPEYVYYSYALMCRGPIEYEAAFEYDKNDLPLKELRKEKGSSETDLFTYHYQWPVK